MGNQKQKWTAEEEDALQRGVQKYGAGKWKNILRDPDFSRSLAIRSNIDLKDKWRNLNVCPGQSSKDKSRTPKIKPLVPVPASPSTAPSPVPTLPNVTPSPQTQTQAPTLTQTQTPTPTPTPTPLPSQNDDDAKTHPKYNAMIFEALSTIKDTNGSDLNAIVSFIEQKHNFPENQNFRRTLGTKLRRLVSQGKLEKVQNCYKIKDTTVVTKSADDPKSPTAREMDSPASSSISKYDEAMKEASETVAYRIADAENKSFLAAAAVKETERYAKFVEENDVMLKFAEELLAKCKLGGSVRFA